MTYTFNSLTSEIIDDDGQVVATLSDNALPEQGEALVRAYNSDNGKLEVARVTTTRHLVATFNN